MNGSVKYAPGPGTGANQVGHGRRRATQQGAKLPPTVIKPKPLYDEASMGRRQNQHPQLLQAVAK
jgi:hypothetical protein